MARTVNDLAKRVLQKLFVIEGDEIPQAEDTALVVVGFNDFVDGMFADGLTPTDEATAPVALVEGVTYTTSSAFPLKDRHFEGVADILAMRVGPADFGTEPSISVAQGALRGDQRLHAAFMPSMVSEVDRALTRLPSSHLYPGDS